MDSFSRQHIKRSRLYLPGLIFLFFLGFYLFTAKGLLSVGDSKIHFLTTRSIVETGSMAVDCQLSSRYIQIGPDGKCYAKYELGLPISLAPFYWLARLSAGPSPASPEGSSIQQLIVSIFGQVVMAATCATVFLFARHISGSKHRAYETAILFGITTLAWPYASLLLSQPLVGLLLLAAVYLLVSSHGDSYRATLFAGISLGWACYVRLDTIVLAAVIAVYLLYILRRQALPWRKIVFHLSLIAIPVAMAVILYGIQNQIRSGSFFSVGYAGEGWTTPLWQGLYGLLLSPGKGLLIFSPLTILGSIGLIGLWKKGWKAEVALFGGLFLAQLAIYSTWWAWAGGWTWGPRFLVSTQAILTLGLVPWLENKRGRVVVAAIATLGFLIQLVGVATDTADYMTRTSFSNTEVLFRPEASQLVGQLADLLQRRVYLLVTTQAYGMFSQVQTIAWVLVSLLLMVLPLLLLRDALKE